MATAAARRRSRQRMVRRHFSHTRLKSSSRHSLVGPAISIATRVGCCTQIILLSVKQLIKLFRFHTFEFRLKLPTVTSVVRLLAGLRLASILLHESADLGLELFFALVHNGVAGSY